MNSQSAKANDGEETSPNLGTPPAPPQPPQATQAPAPRAGTAACPNGTTVTTSAHQDDTLLFMAPDILHDIQNGKCVRSIFVTAGDAGDPNPAYWMGRELGAEAGYASLAGKPNAWTTADAGIPGHPMPLATLNGNPKVSLVFIRLPDGLGDGSGFPVNDFQSLQKLYLGQSSTITTVNGSQKSSYTKDDLTRTLASLIEAMEPDRIDTQDFAGAYGDGDHSDHHTVAYLTRDAHRLATITTTHVLYSYMDYQSQNEPANVSGADLQAKQASFLAYARHDNTQCQTQAQCDQGVIGAWERRQYTTGSEAGGPGVSFKPVAIMGPNQFVHTNETVQLRGAATVDPNGPPPSFQWKQTAGPLVTLSDPAALSPTFTAPGSASRLDFQLFVTQGGQTSQLRPQGPMRVTVAPPAVVASPQYGVANQTDVFTVNSDGAVYVRWVQGGGAWHGPERISQVGLARGGTHLAVSNQFGIPSQTDVFLVGNDGAMYVLWVQGAGLWNTFRIANTQDTVEPGAPLAATHRFGIPNQTDVFAVNNNGAVQVSSVQAGGAWQAPVAITGKTAPPGAGITTSNQFGIANQTDVFTVNNDGHTQVSWWTPGAPWRTMAIPSNSAPPGAGIAATNQFGIPNQTDVFTVNNDGAAQVSWVLGGGAWQGPLAITPSNTNSPGANLAPSNQFGIPNQTDVFAVGNDGATRVSWVAGAGAWKGPMPITPAGNAVIGAPLAASNQFGIPNQTDVFVINHSGSPQVVWVQGGGAWQGPIPI